MIHFRRRKQAENRGSERRSKISQDPFFRSGVMITSAGRNLIVIQLVCWTRDSKNSGVPCPTVDIIYPMTTKGVRMLSHDENCASRTRKLHQTLRRLLVK